LIDGDGDQVRFTVSKGDITGHISRSFPIPQGVFNVDLSDTSFDGTNLSVSVTKSKIGDGIAIVGYINAGMNSLGQVQVAGDLGEIDVAGFMKSLTVGSMGRFGQLGAGDGDSRIGNLSSLVVKGDIHGLAARSSVMRRGAREAAWAMEAQRPVPSLSRSLMSLLTPHRMTPTLTIPE
jgi:hypothetical protein